MVISESTVSTSQHGTYPFWDISDTNINTSHIQPMFIFSRRVHGEDVAGEGVAPRSSYAITVY